MKEEKLINSLLHSKLNWWNRFWKQLIKIVKPKKEVKNSIDSAYQVYLDELRKDIVRKNSAADSVEDPAYQVYLDAARAFLESKEKRLLTEREEEIITAHLVSVMPICRSIRGGSIVQALSIETAEKVSELHEGLQSIDVKIEIEDE